MTEKLGRGNQVDNWLAQEEDLLSLDPLGGLYGAWHQVPDWLGLVDEWAQAELGEHRGDRLEDIRSVLSDRARGRQLPDVSVAGVMSFVSRVEEMKKTQGDFVAGAVGQLRKVLDEQFPAGDLDRKGIIWPHER